MATWISFGSRLAACLAQAPPGSPFICMLDCHDMVARLHSLFVYVDGAASSKHGDGCRRHVTEQ
jgi:hypothetical protein